MIEGHGPSYNIIASRLFLSVYDIQMHILYIIIFWLYRNMNIKLQYCNVSVLFLNLFLYLLNVFKFRHGSKLVRYIFTYVYVVFQKEIFSILL